MCPGTLAITAMIGAGIRAGGSILGGIAQGNAASYQAQVAANNAIIARQNAQYAEEAGMQQAMATSLQGASTLGKVKAAQAANNIDVNTGSAVRVQQSQRELNALNAATALSNAELSAYGYRAAATGYQAQAGLEQMQAEAAPIGGLIGGAGNLLSNASSIGFKWANAQPFGADTTSNPLTAGSLY